MCVYILHARLLLKPGSQLIRSGLSVITMQDYSALYQCHMGPQVSAWFAVHCSHPTLWHSTRLMHSSVNVQGQVLRLVQGDTRLLNYGDNLIAFKSQEATA